MSDLNQLRDLAGQVRPPSFDSLVTTVRRRRRRAAAGAAGTAVILMIGAGALSVRDEDGSAPGPAGDVKNGVIVDSIGGDADADAAPPLLAGLTDSNAAPYPVWQAFDQDTGRFLFTGNAHPGSVRVLAPGLDTPLATIRCVGCSWPTFGPGADEVTTVQIDRWPPQHAQVYGFDGSLHDEIDISGVLDGSGIADIAWSPDGTRLAVSTYTGSREPDCPGTECEVSIWILDEFGGDPLRIYRQITPPQADPNPPVLQDLAWAPGGERLAAVRDSLGGGAPDTLVTISLDTGELETIHEFDRCGACSPSFYGYAWSPDGTRIAVTSGHGITQLSSDGTVLVAEVGSEKGPLAWLVEPSD